LISIDTIVEHGVLARSLCTIEHDRQRGPRELVGQMALPTRQSLNDPVRQDQKFQRQVVHIQSFVIELHHARSRDLLVA
jgi:hypothetical protein